MGMARGKVDILYDDGTSKTYTQSRIETRISLGEVYIYAYMHACINIHGETYIRCFLATYLT